MQCISTGACVKCVPKTMLLRRELQYFHQNIKHTAGSCVPNGLKLGSNECPMYPNNITTLTFLPFLSDLYRSSCIIITSPSLASSPLGSPVLSFHNDSSFASTLLQPTFMGVTIQTTKKRKKQTK